MSQRGERGSKSSARGGRREVYDVRVIRRDPLGGRDLMTRALTGVVVAALLSTVAFSQSTDSTPAFALADVHRSPRSTTPAMRISSRAGHYEIRNATMVDLIRTAYTLDADNILGGPSWLEYDRFDVVALVPPNTTP